MGWSDFKANIMVINIIVFLKKCVLHSHFRLKLFDLCNMLFVEDFNELTQV